MNRAAQRKAWGAAANAAATEKDRPARNEKALREGRLAIQFAPGVTGINASEVSPATITKVYMMDDPKEYEGTFGVWLKAPEGGAYNIGKSFVGKVDKEGKTFTIESVRSANTLTTRTGNRNTLGGGARRLTRRRRGSRRHRKTRARR